MASKKRGLSKGLGALLADTLEPIEPKKATSISKTTKNQADYKIVNIDTVRPGPFQPRQKILEEELTSLTDSIKKQGVLQPIVVQEGKDGFAIIAGERRWRAAKLAGKKEIPVVVKKVTDEQGLKIALIENIQRQNLNPVDEAMALDKLAKKYELTHEGLAKAVGRSRSSITNLLRLLNLPPEILRLVKNEAIDLGHAKVLLGTPKILQAKIANSIVFKQLSVRAAEQMLANELQKGTSRRKSVDPDLKRLQQRLCKKFGAKVKITHHNSGQGKILISYNSLAEFEGILSHFTLESE